MIRRLNKHSDLKDLIKSCPSGVIDDIYAIEYYIQGYNTVIQENFTKKETMLEVIIPSTDLETLPNGILMRRAYYKVLDASYPDGYYNLEFEDNMNVWIGENESEEPVIPEYVTEEELSSTLSSYATQDWVSSQQFLTSDSLPSGLATQSWVMSYTYDSSTIDYACGKAEDNAITWVQEQGYLTASTIPSDIATQSWVSSQQFATQSWVHSQGYITIGEIPSGLATQSWVQSQGYLTSVPSEYVTQSWVEEQNFAVDSEDDPIITEGVLNDVLTGYATQSWVQSQGYLTQHQDLTGYATQSWVGQQGYITSSALSGYATQSWATDQFLEESKVWVGTREYWEMLTSEEQAAYKIALVTG